MLLHQAVFSNYQCLSRNERTIAGRAIISAIITVSHSHTGINIPSNESPINIQSAPANVAAANMIAIQSITFLIMLFFFLIFTSSFVLV